MADQENPHFNKIFWYIMVTTVLSLAYVATVTFKIIPEKNQHTVDFTVGFLLGTVVSSGIGYLLGGNPATSAKKTSILPENSDTNIDITTTKKEGE